MQQADLGHASRAGDNDIGLERGGIAISQEWEGHLAERGVREAKVSAGAELLGSWKFRRFEFAKNAST